MADTSATPVPFDEPYRPVLQPAIGLDPGIREIVNKLRSEGIETYESCEGGDGHCFAEPTVRFHGAPHDGYRALSVCLMLALPVCHLRRFWRMLNGELEGPEWEMTFRLDGYVGKPYVDQIRDGDV